MKIKNKKVIIVTILSCITLSVCGCKRSSAVQAETSTVQEEASTVQEETSAAQEETSTSEKQQEVESINASKINNSNFFFEDITKGKVYHVRHSFFTDAIPDEVLLQITMESQYESGTLYRIKCDFDEDFPGRYDLGYDRFSLGYFYVQNDSAVIYRIREEDMTNEIMESEEKIMSAGTVVCQEQEKKDILGEGEDGWHEWIAVDDDRREYHSYNNLTGTGFYEQFVWERGYGLIYYTSGFGADKDMIEIAETESKILNPIISESTNNKEEKTVLRFGLIDTNEMVSVCIGNEDQSYIVCRIGKIGEDIREYPDKRENTWDYYNYSYYFCGGGNENEGMDLNCLTYEDDDLRFEIHEDYVNQDDKGELLIRTINKKTGEETIQEGDPESREGSLVNLRDDDDIEIIPYDG